LTDGHTEPPAHVWALLGLMVTLWSVNFVVAKIALRDFPPLMAGALRFTFAGGMIWPLYWWKKRGANPGSRDPAGMARLVGIGVLGVGLNQLFFLLGLERTSVGHAALVIATTPVLVLLMSAFAGHERIAPKKVAGLAVALSGVAYLQMSPSKSTGATVLGDVFIFLASLTFALFTVFGKSVVRRYDSLTVNTFAYVGSGIVLSPLTLWYAAGFRFSEVSWAGWLAMLYMAVFPSLLCYMIYYYALGFIPATRISMLSYSQPVLATVFAILLLGEHLTQTLVVGGLLVLTGVVLAERA
jgi:drug/metabolite transporter (DMT)-like permease